MNTIHIIGRAAASAEMRYTPSGTAVASFSVASNRKYGDSETVVWFRVTLWGKLAESVSQYVTKGKEVYVVGRFDKAPDVWTDKQGENRASLEVTAESLKLLGSRGDSGNGGASMSDDVANSFANDEDIPF